MWSQNRVFQGNKVGSSLTFTKTGLHSMSSRLAEYARKILNPKAVG